MRIGILSQWFDPETGPAALPAVYAREFVRAGHEVAVLTGFPNYPEGRIYPGYKQSFRAVEETDGITVTRVPLYANHSSSAIGRVANYASFAAAASLLGVGALRGVDAIWVYNSPITVHVPLMLHSRWGRVPYFLHVQDVWPDSLLESGMIPSGPIGRVVGRLVATVVRKMELRASAVGVISPGVRELVLERNPGVDPNRIVFAPNPANESLFRPLAARRRAGGEPFTILYAGAIGEVQGFEAVIEAAAALHDSSASIHFTFAGDGIALPRLKRIVEERGLSNVSFLGRVPQESIPVLMADADAQLVSLADSPFLRRTLPSKVSAILASQSPILAVINGDGARILRESNGAVVTPSDPRSIADAARRLAALTPDELSDLGRNGRQYYEDNFSARATAHTIIRTLEGFTGDH